MKTDIIHNYIQYADMNRDEEQYLSLLYDVISYGVRKENRTEVPTFSLVARTLRFNLGTSTRRILPLLTTKKMNYNLVLSELLWFLRGEYHIKSLQDAGNHIWDGNGTREFLDSRGLHDRAAGDLGPIYGVQWRRFNTPDYHDASAGGIDQISALISGLRRDPYSRRHIVTAWNPAQLEHMALPPCHFAFQIVMQPTLIMDMVVHMRSADLPLGVPFNVASYATLAHLLSHITGYAPGTLHLTMNDAHVYENQLPGVVAQIRRRSREFPTLTIRDAVRSVDDVSADDFTVHNYNPQPFIKYELSV